MPLLGLGFGGLLGRCPRMVRNRLHGALVHRLRAFSIEGRARRNDPVIRRLGSSAAGTGLDAAGIDALLGFATRQVSLGIDRALTREVLPLLSRIRVANDHQLGIRFVLQARRVVGGTTDVLICPWQSWLFPRLGISRQECTSFTMACDGQLGELTVTVGCEPHLIWIDPSRIAPLFSRPSY